MAGRFLNPYPQFFDSTPEVYAGGFLYFYASGTDTPLATYTNEGLSSANTNPVELNAAGRPPFDIFLQDLEYKVVLKDSSLNTIWTADPVSHRDSALVAKTLTGSGSPNGSVAGTAGSASILPDFYWDYTNSILYVCTTTGSSSTAVWTAVNASSATPAVPPPQGRLTPTSATPVITTGITSGTAVYYTPYAGNLIPIYNGATMTPTEFSELTLTLVSAHSANTLYDVFVFSNSGVLTLVTGPAWNTSTAGSGARGTGASTTQITRIKGLWVNAVQMTARNGSTTYTVGANLATYVGSLSIDGSAGQITCHTAWGQSRRWAVWNCYNRESIKLKAGDSTASWSYNTGTFRASNGSSANSISVFCGLAEEPIKLQFDQGVSASGTVQLGIGVNSTTVASGFAPTYGAVASAITASYLSVPRLGANTFTCLEFVGGSASTMNGTETSMVLYGEWRG
jgi:hypothetical protein